MDDELKIHSADLKWVERTCKSPEGAFFKAIYCVDHESRVWAKVYCSMNENDPEYIVSDAIGREAVFLEHEPAKAKAWAWANTSQDKVREEWQNSKQV